MKMKRRWAKGGQVLTAAAFIGVVATTPAKAAQTDFIAMPGVFMNITFGERWNFGFGLDLHATFVFKTSEDDKFATSGVGLYAQATWLIASNTARYSAGLHGGYRPQDNPLERDFEVGWVWQGAVCDQPAGHGIQIGFSTFVLFGDVALRLTLIDGGDGWMPEGHLALGTRRQSRLGLPRWEGSEGRPQRDGQTALMGRVFVRGCRLKRRDLSKATTRAAIGVQWAEAARAEAASIPAFVALARDLQTAQAPADLVRRALVAVADEVRHAQVSAKIARRYLGRPLAVEVPNLHPATSDETSVHLLSRLAVESWRDGCLGEGIEAVRAAERGKITKSRYVRASLQTIAREEATHAELAWDVLIWATQKGGTTALDAVAEAVAESAARAGVAPVGGYRVPGDLDGTAKARIAEAVRVEAVGRWRRTLGTG